MNRGNILVIGAGIGGLSTAIALRRRGFDVHVVERQSDARDSVYGVGIAQPANALRALDALGCLEACLEQGFASEAWGRMFDQTGNLIGDIHGVTIEGYPPQNGITRPRLHRILTDRALASGAIIEYNQTFTDLESGDADVQVTFGDGARRSFDLVVGADGVNSSVRRFVLDQNAECTPLGQSAFRINIPRLPEMDRILLYAGRGDMAGIVPIGPNLAYLFLQVTAEKDWRPGTKEMYAILKERLAPYGSVVGRVRDEYFSEASEIVLRPEEYLIVPAPWHKGRVVLIGDAVHAVTPHLGQGAAQAIEDAVVLAEELDGLTSLKDRTENVEQAFLAYAERRYERCKLIVETSAALARWQMDPSTPFDIVDTVQRVTEAMAAPI